MEYVQRLTNPGAVETMASVLSAGMSFRQVQQARQQMEQSERLHRLEKIYGERHHKRDRNQAERHFYNDYSREVEHHLHDVVSGMVSSNAEADRDMWEQKNAELQMMMLSATVIFSGGFAIAVEGELATDASAVEEILYACGLACGFASLLMSILFGMILSKRISFFMYAQSSARQKNVQDIIRYGQKLVEMNYFMWDSKRRAGAATAPVVTIGGKRSFRMRREDSMGSIGSDATEGAQGHNDDAGAAGTAGAAGAVGASDGAGSAKVERGTSRAPDLNDWVAETEFRVAMADLYTSLTSVPQLSFKDYFVRYARTWSTWVTHSFMIGLIALLLSTGVMFYSRFRSVHNNKSAAYVFIIMLAASGLTSIVLLGNFFFNGLQLDRMVRKSRRKGRSFCAKAGVGRRWAEKHRHWERSKRRTPGTGGWATSQRTLDSLLRDEFGKMVPAAAMVLMHQVHRVMRRNLCRAEEEEEEARARVPEALRLGRHNSSRFGGDELPQAEAVPIVDRQPPKLIDGLAIQRIEKRDIVLEYTRHSRGARSDQLQVVDKEDLFRYLKEEVSEPHKWNIFQENAWLVMWDANGDGIISVDELWRGALRSEMDFLESEFFHLREVLEQSEHCVSGFGRMALTRQIALLGLSGSNFTVFEWKHILNSVGSFTDEQLGSCFLWATREPIWLDRTPYPPHMLVPNGEVNLKVKVSVVDMSDFLDCEERVSGLEHTMDALHRELKRIELLYTKLVFESCNSASAL